MPSEKKLHSLLKEHKNIFVHSVHSPMALHKLNLLCNNSFIRFNISFGETVAVAPVPDF